MSIRNSARFLHILVALSCKFALQSILIMLIVTASSAQAAPNIESGTVNVVLANRHGAVVAADSRKTDIRSGTYSDDSQKLFRAGQRSAVVIAGFASWYKASSPIGYQVEALLRSEVSGRPKKHLPKGLDAIVHVVSFNLGLVLNIVGGYYAATGSRPPLDFVATSVGVSNDHRLKIVTTVFSPEYKAYGSRGISFPQFRASSTEIVVTHFTSATQGVTNVANAILEGTYPTSDPRVLRFYEAQRTGKLDDFGLSDLRQLSEAILDETGRVTRYVGGPTQIAVIPRRGKPSWVLLNVDSSQRPLTRMISRKGVPYGRAIESDPKGTQYHVEFSESFNQPISQPFTQVFYGGRFVGIEVALDGNVFGGNSFEDVVFRWRGGHFLFDNNAVGEKCYISVEGNAQFPRMPGMGHCLTTGVPSFQRLPIGRPVYVKEIGCVIRDREGYIKEIKRKGKYKGKRCEGSRLEVPLGSLIE